MDGTAPTQQTSKSASFCRDTGRTSIACGNEARFCQTFVSVLCARCSRAVSWTWRPVSLARQQHLEMMLNGIRHACIDGRPAAGSTWTVGGAPPPALYVLPTGWRLYGMKLELFPCDTVAADSGARTMGKLVITVDYSRGLWVDEWRQAQNATAVRTSLRNTQLN